MSFCSLFLKKNMNTEVTQMTTRQIANRLAELCRKGDFASAQKELFADDAVSIEPYPSPDFDKETKGLNNILAKGDKFESMVDTMHSFTVSEPLIAGNSFAMTMDMDATMKGKDRMKMTELCIYKLKDGKIISEEFLM